jgi:hypothetical protein
MQLQATVKAVEVSEAGRGLFVKIVYYDPFNELDFTVEGIFEEGSEIPQVRDKFTITVNKALPLPVVKND